MEYGLKQSMPVEKKAGLYRRYIVGSWGSVVCCVLDKVWVSSLAALAEGGRFRPYGFPVTRSLAASYKQWTAAVII